MAEYKEAKTPRERGKKLAGILMKEGEDGGHVLEHQFEHDGMTFHRPKEHVFGEDEGHEMIQHVVKHMHVRVSDGVHKALDTPSEPEEPEEEGHQPAEAEYYAESKGRKG